MFTGPNGNTQFDWTATDKNFNVGAGPEHGFDGNDGVWVFAQGGNSVMWRPSTPITGVTSVEMYTDTFNDNVYGINSTEVTVSADSPIQPGTRGYKLLNLPAGFDGTLNNLGIRCDGSTASSPGWGVIRINGQVYIDGQNPSYGANGFHLDFSDPDDLGADRSGNGNDFTASGGFNTDPVGIFSNDCFREPYTAGDQPDLDNFATTTDQTNISQALANGFDGTDDNASLYQDGAMVFRPTNPIENVTHIRSRQFGGQRNALNGTSLDNSSTVNSDEVLYDGDAVTLTTWGAWSLSSGAADGGWRTLDIRVNSGAWTTLVDNTGEDYDHMTDSPTQNFATLNPIYPYPSVVTLSDANLKYFDSNTAYATPVLASMVAAGKCYWEYTINGYNASAPYLGIGDATVDPLLSANGWMTGNAFFVAPNGMVWNWSPAVPNDWVTYVTGDVIGFAYDSSNKQITVTKNGGDSKTWTANAPGAVIPVCALSSSKDLTVNYGQQPLLYKPAGFEALQTQNLPAADIVDGRDHFRAITGPGSGGGAGAGDITGNFSAFLTCSGSGFATDRTAIRAFNNDEAVGAQSSEADRVITWTPQPAFDFTNNLQVRTLKNNNRARINGGAWVDLTANSMTQVAAGDGTVNTLEIESSGGNTVSLSGIRSNGQLLVDDTILGSAQDIFPNGLWWIKDRKNSNQHQLLWSGGGTNVIQLPDVTRPDEQTYAPPAGNSVAWCWSAPDTWASTDADVTAGTIASSGRRNVAAGFSIVNYVGTGNSGTIGHGLSKDVDFLIQTSIDETGGTSRYVWHRNLTTQAYYFWLQTNDPEDNVQDLWGTNTFSGNVFSVSDNFQVNRAGNNNVAFCWTARPGYSAFGSYQGNDNSDGVFVYTGFRPAFVMFKSTNTSADWIIYDTTRNPTNPVDARLMPNRDLEERTSTGMHVDFLSNGFKHRNQELDLNNNFTYIYAAFAENPFGSSNTSPANAR